MGRELGCRFQFGVKRQSWTVSFIIHGITQMADLYMRKIIFLLPCHWRITSRVVGWKWDREVGSIGCGNVVGREPGSMGFQFGFKR